MAIRDWIHDRETMLRLVFTTKEVRAAFPALSDQVVKNDLLRRAKAGRIEAVHRGVYVIVPAKYERRGAVPPTFYMDSLMRILGRDYYFGLLTAARMWGAAHQLPMSETVVTTRPDMSASRRKNAQVAWCYRDRIPARFVRETKGEYDRVRVSSPELTALDLVRFERFAGGLSRVATVLSELSERADFSNAAESGLLATATVPTVQRLGHLLESVVGDRGRADVLYAQLEKSVGRRFKRVPLDRRGHEETIAVDGRWKVDVNCRIERDET